MTISLTLAVTPSPDAQQRKSLRWAASSVDSYDYKIAASMISTDHQRYQRGHGGHAEIGYTADIAMAQLYAREGSLKCYEPPKGKLLHTWYAYPMVSFMAAPAKDGAGYKCLSDFNPLAWLRRLLLLQPQTSLSARKRCH